MKRKSATRDHDFCPISPESKLRVKLTEVCLNTVCTQIVVGFVDFRAESEDRAKTFELAFENN